MQNSAPQWAQAWCRLPFLVKHSTFILTMLLLKAFCAALLIGGAMETERKSVLYWQWGSACSVVCVCPCESCCWLVKKHLKHGFYQTCEKSFVSVSEKAAVGFWLSEERYFCHGVVFFGSGHGRVYKGCSWSDSLFLFVTKAAVKG